MNIHGNDLARPSFRTSGRPRGPSGYEEVRGAGWRVWEDVEDVREGVREGGGGVNKN